MRAFRTAGVQILHGPVSGSRCGNWAPRWFVEQIWALRLRYDKNMDLKVSWVFLGELLDQHLAE